MTPNMFRFSLSRHWPSLLALGLFATIASFTTPVYAIPAFARIYDVPCQTCHITITRRNEFGDAFRRAGYRWPNSTRPPGNDDEHIELRGTTPLDGWLPRMTPIAVVGTIAGQVSTDPNLENPLSLNDPSLLLVLGANLGNNISIFGTWNPSGPPTELYLHFARIFGGPEANVRVGLFEQWTTGFKINESLVQQFNISTRSINAFTLAASRLGVEVNGVLGGRTFYALGAVENGYSLSNPNIDGYYRIEHRFGGMDLLGEEPEIDLMAEDSFWDHVSLTIAQWGYIGQVYDDNVLTNAWSPRRLGVDLRLSVYNVNVWGGLMFGIDRDLISQQDRLNLTWFAEISYPFEGWLTPLYAFQYHDADTLMEPVMEHHVGLLALLIENLRLRGRFRFTDDGVDNEVVDLQLLFAF